MSKAKYKLLSLILSIGMSVLIGYAIYTISGRNVVADFVRPLLATFAVFLGTFLLVSVNRKILAFIGLFIIGLPVSCCSVLAYIYYKTIGAVFTGDDVVAIGQSNIEEIWDFLSHYIFNFNSLIATIVTCLIYILIAWLLHKSSIVDPKTIELIKQLKEESKNSQDRLGTTHHTWRIFFKNIKLQAYMGAALMFATALVLYTQFRPVAYYRLMTNELQEKIATFNHLVRELHQSDVYQAAKEKQGELYVLIIGESLSCDSMGLYNKSVDNTPFLNKLAQNGRTVVFPNAYSSFVNTVPSITASFSQGNLQTGLTFPYGANLISLSKRAGITTYWISNQVKNGNADTPIGAISALADHSYFTTEFVFDGSYSQQPDMILLPKLKETFQNLDAKKNNLVIIHLMGNHSPYYNRFPKDFPKIQLNGASKLGKLVSDQRFSDSLLGSSDFENYLTAIKYNDMVIEEIYKLFADREDFQAMLYYSDHGEDILHHAVDVNNVGKISVPAARHNVAQFSYAMTRIPLIITFSEKFAERYPATTEALFENKEQVFTNDTLYDLMLDLMQVKSKEINYSLSLASPEFNRPKPVQLMIVNDKVVGEDPDYLAFRHARLPSSDKFAIYKSNALFKANNVLSKGYKNLHVNVMLHNDKLYVKAVQNFDESFLELKDFINSLQESPNIILDFDDADLDVNDTAKINQYSKIIGDTLLKLNQEQQRKLYFFSASTDLLEHLENFLVENHMAYENAKKAQVDIATKPSETEFSKPHLKNIQRDEDNTRFARLSIEQQHNLLVQNRECNVDLNSLYHFPVNLGWRITKFSDLDKLEDQSSLIHYIMVKDNIIASITPDALCGRSMIVIADQLDVQDVQFVYKMSLLIQRLPFKMLVVNYRQIFDSDF